MFNSIILYICADNDLSDYAYTDINELKYISIPQYIQVDQRLRAWGDTQPNSYRIFRKDGIEKKIILENELNTGDANTLNEFLSWVKSLKVHLEQSLFIFWGHGEGWVGSCKDFLNKDILDLHEIQKVISNYTFKAIGFDACIMASLEVMDALKSSAHFFLASQEIEPKKGWNYSHFELKENNFPNFINKMANFYIKQQSTNSLCLSLINLEHIPRLIKKLNVLFEQLSFMFAEYKKIGDEAHRIANGEYIDLYILLWRIKMSLPKVSTIANSLMELIEQQIVLCNYSNSSNYRGISIWFPKSVRSYKIERYAKLPIVSSCPAYLDLLQRYITIK